ncbi:unnamed protein product, partial [Heterosigma akashiwo]
GRRYAEWYEGNNSKVLWFLYTVTEDDGSSHLDYDDKEALAVSGGTWCRRLSTYPTTDADLRLASRGTEGSLSDNSFRDRRQRRPLRAEHAHGPGGRAVRCGPGGVHRPVLLRGRERGRGGGLHDAPELRYLLFWVRYSTHSVPLHCGNRGLLHRPGS